jgi:hypothetical protein
MCGCNRPKNVKTFFSNGVKYRTISGSAQPRQRTSTIVRQQSVARQISNSKLSERKAALRETRRKIIYNKFGK